MSREITKWLLAKEKIQFNKSTIFLMGDAAQYENMSSGLTLH